jgi:16S rRNA C1402 (ribose-2'-O) methylase RsmI
MESSLLDQWLEAAGKHEFALAKGLFQTGHELATKDPAQYLHRQEERKARVNPVLVIERQTTRGDHTMNVRMVQEVLAPGMEHTQEADLGTEMPRVAGDLQQSRGAGAKQEVVDDCLVLQSQPRKLMG